MLTEPYIFFPGFIFMWILISFGLSRMGWIHIVRKYRSVSHNTGTKLGFVMSTINGIPYKNVQCIFYTEKNLFISNFVLFRTFHPPVLIPLENFQLTIENGFRGRKKYAILSEDPVYMEFRLDRSQGEEFEQFLISQNLIHQIKDRTNL